jgi:RNA polymerase sigma-70 factor (ECF subfamily)
MQEIEQIYNEYFETVYKYLICLTRNEELSEELTQETFYRAIKGIKNLKNECKMSTWLCQIAKNLWYNYLKKNKRIVDIKEDDLFFITDVNENTEDTIISKNSKLELYKKIQKLDEDVRNVIYLRITGELSFKEIATILNKTENWARVTFYRGKQKLKEGDLYEK